MALEEVSFYNTNGDEINLTNVVNQMINYYNLKFEVGETKITDFNEGSEIRNLLEAFAVGVYALMEQENESTKINFIDTSYGAWLDKIGEQPFIDLPRVEGKEAEGVVKFTIAEAIEEDYVIPEDTLLEASDLGISFITTSDATIYAGDTTCEALIEALDTGKDGNVGTGEIDTITDEEIDTEFLTVTNETPTVNGTNYEDDDDYRRRLFENVQADGFGSMGYYKRLGEAVNGVHDVKLIDSETENITKTVIVNGDEKPTPESVILDCFVAFTDILNIVLGHKFEVTVPEYTTVNLDIDINVTTTVDTDHLTLFLTKYFNGGDIPSITFTGLMIGEKVTWESIASIIIMNDNIVKVNSIQSNNAEITEISPSANGVLKLGTVSYTQHEVN